MSSNIRPLLSALKRSPTGALLVALQVAITLAVLVNAVCIVHQRIEKIERPAGLATRDTFALAVMGSSKKFDVAAAEIEDLAYLRNLPGVVSATLTDGIPLSGNGGDTALFLQPGHRGRVVNTAELPMDSQGLKTLGVSLIAGRNFRATEIEPSSPEQAPPAQAIITESLAHALFPKGGALGKTIYGSTPKTIIGITRNFMGPQLGQPVYNVVIYPMMPAGVYFLLVRTRPGKSNAILHVVKSHIAKMHRYAAIPFTQTLSDAQRKMESANRNVAILLTLVTALMVGVCGLGIFGLTTFNVGSRTRQIGTRRAVGARQGDIVTHFMMENALIMMGGTLLGIFLALAASQWLTTYYALPRVSLAYVLVGVVTLWVIGQLAAWQPARRAARIPPSVATRTV